MFLSLRYFCLDISVPFFIQKQSGIQIMLPINLLLHMQLYSFLHNNYITMRALIVVYLLAIAAKIQCGQFLLATLPLKTANFQCLKSSGISRIGLALLYNQSGVQEQSAQNIANALTAGLTVEVIFVPNRTRFVQDQISTMKKYINLNIIDRYWLFPDSWDKYTPYQNCQYLQEFLAAMRDINLSAGIWAGKIDWIQAFKDQRGCSEVSNALLWWMPENSQIDGQPNFNNYNQIGGWKVPYMKLFEVTKICEIGFFNNYFK